MFCLLFGFFTSKQIKQKQFFEATGFSASRYNVLKIFFRKPTNSNWRLAWSNSAKNKAKSNHNFQIYAKQFFTIFYISDNPF